MIYKLTLAKYGLQSSQFFDQAESLMKRDLSERETDEYGQNVREKMLWNGEDGIS